MGRKATFTDEQIAGALALIDNGHTWKQAAASIGISLSRLQNRAAALKDQPYPSSTTAYGAMRRYKLSGAEYSGLVRNQDGKCAICGLHVDQLVVDHCHRSGKVRALLCQPCNMGLGWVEKMLTVTKEGWLDRVAQYLAEHAPGEVELQERRGVGRPPFFTEEQIRHAKALREGGATWQEAAGAIKISITRLQARIRELCQTN